MRHCRAMPSNYIKKTVFFQIFLIFIFYESKCVFLSFLMCSKLEVIWILPTPYSNYITECLTQFSSRKIDLDNGWKCSVQTLRLRSCDALYIWLNIERRIFNSNKHKILKHFQSIDKHMLLRIFGRRLLCTSKSYSEWKFRASKEKVCFW